MKTTFGLSVIFFVVVFTQSCKKKDLLSTPTNVDTIPATTSELDLLRDSIYLYTKEVYLWHEVIPPYNIFNPRHFTGATELEAAQNEMAGIRDLQVEDKKHQYSFVTTQDESDAIQTGENKDFGFFIKAGSIDKAKPNDSVYWFVEYVYKNSPSGLAGVQKGWYISKINNSNIGYDNSSVDVLNQVFFGNTKWQILRSLKMMAQR